MTAERSAKQRDASRFAAQRLTAAAMVAAALLAAKPALAQSPFNPYGSFTDSGPVTPEEKARREQVRTDLYDRLSPAYRIEVPSSAKRRSPGCSKPSSAIARSWPTAAGPSPRRR